jgi:ABC-type multidrug transport system fused ATPase/permease subunit
MTNIWMDVVACGFYVALLFSMDVQLTLVLLIVFPLYILCMRTFGAESKRTSKEVQGSDGRVLRRSAGTRCRLRAGQELRQRATRSARLLRQRTRASTTW